MWVEVALPPIPTPILACSVPINGDAAAVWTNTGVFRVRLNKTPVLFRSHSPTEAETKFDAEKGQFLSYGYDFVMTGFCGKHGWRKDPQLTIEHAHGDRIDCDLGSSRVRIVNPAGMCTLEVSGVQSADKFILASFSRFWIRKSVSKYFVVCDTNQLRIFRYKSDRAGAAPKWSSYGNRATKESLLKAIVNNPDDDFPRLVFADWLEEHGDVERAEFIRIQCRIAERNRLEFVPQMDPDRIRMEELQKQNAERWIAELGTVRGFDFETKFHRGFPIAIVNRMSVATKSATLADLLSRVPFDYVSLYRIREPDITSIANWSAPSRWRHLQIYNSCHESFPFTERILKKSTLGGLRSIEFHGWFGSELTQAVCESAARQNLEQLSIHWPSIQDGDRPLLPLLTKSRCPESMKIVTFHSTIHMSSINAMLGDLKRLAKRVENVIFISQESRDTFTEIRL
jgi:uncharacterized protein (TIGR02996 family)